MQIVLVTKIENVGNLGDIIHVKPGYARNFLIPFGKAIIATKSNIELILNKKKKLEQKLLEKLSLAKSRIDKINMIAQPIIIFSKSRKEGKLFGSVGPRDIAETLSNLSGIEVKKGEVHISEGLLREVGQYNVVFKPHHQVETIISINIISKDNNSLKQV
ncbi:50S ribosomal protein L9 [Buchnera aphidicola]|uniref:Large ribosomal subunit protein bL9 n=1 Tax=Buchnera aphidicola subsp. Melaphis rhois TaxID=118103 RepID=A0A4D6YC10_BUCMH|nr:50S ribosomal protein L9 [Buchnera aphidicola]QCI23514.1 50S ribosomal protein L9 [Buchnera aphidicola (Melaphis rhois)]